MARKTKLEAEQTRLAIIAAARDAFYKNGVNRTSLDDVAQLAGVTRGAIYWHFRNKVELFFAMRDQMPLPLVDGLDESPHDIDGDPFGSLERVLSAIPKALASQPDLKRTHQILAFRCEYVDELATVFERIYVAPGAPLMAWLERAYVSAQRAGLLRSGVSAKELAFDTAAFMHGLVTRWLAADGSTAVHRHSLRSIRAHLALRRP